MAAQAGLSLPWSQTPKTGFLVMWLKNYKLADPMLQYFLLAKTINVLFPETSQSLLGSVGRKKFFFFFFNKFLSRKSIKIIQNTLKIDEKFSDVQKNLE